MHSFKNKWSNFKLLWRLVHQYKRTIMLWLAAKVIVSTLVPFVQVLTMSKVIAWLSAGVSVAEYIEQLLVWLFMVLLLTSLDAYLTNKFNYFSECFRIKLITPVNEQQISLDYPLITGKEGSRKYWDAMMLLDYRGTALGRVFDEWSAIATGLLSVLLYSSLLLSLEGSFVLLILIALIGFVHLRRRQEQLKEAKHDAELKNRRQYNYMSTIIGDNRLAKDLRLYHMEAWFRKVKQELVKAYYQITAKMRLHRMIENVFVAAVLIVLSYRAYFSSIELIATGNLPVADFIVYVGTITLVTSSLLNLVTQLSAFNVSLLELSAYADFMEQTAVFNHDSQRAAPSSVDSIEFRNVSYTYPGKQQATIKGLNLTIHRHETLAIVGSNGAGKTTLVKLLLGLLQADEGQILINGLPQNDYRITDLYHLFAPIFQDHTAFTFTIREAIIQDYPFNMEKYQQVLVDSGMDTIIQQLPNGDKSHYVKEVYADSVQLSGGQMQRLKLAQALYKDAPILVLDEPTAALDPIAESEVYERFNSFSERRMALFISHRLASTRFCDRIIYLDGGTIIEEGSHDELIAKGGAYYDLFETQAYYYRENATTTMQVINEANIVERGDLSE